VSWARLGADAALLQVGRERFERANAALVPAVQTIKQLVAEAHGAWLLMHGIDPEPWAMSPEPKRERDAAERRLGDIRRVPYLDHLDNAATEFLHAQMMSGKIGSPPRPERSERPWRGRDLRLSLGLNVSLSCRASGVKRPSPAELAALAVVVGVEEPSNDPDEWARRQANWKARMKDSIRPVLKQAPWPGRVRRARGPAPSPFRDLRP
jgi:hypothetical protein